MKYTPYVNKRRLEKALSTQPQHEKVAEKQSRNRYLYAMAIFCSLLFAIHGSVRTFCKWIRVNFQFCDQLILIGSDRREYRLGKDERFMIQLL